MGIHSAKTTGAFLILTHAVFSCGCQTSKPRPSGSSAVQADWTLSQNSEQGLRTAMLQYADFASAEVARVADLIQQQDADQSVQRSALKWKLFAFEAEHDAAAKHPLQMLLDGWGSPVG